MTTNLKEQFLQLGGNPETFDQFSGNPEKQKLLVSIQKDLHSFTNGARTKSNPELVRNAFQKLDELRSVDVSQLDKNSDKYREHFNKMIKEENIIRSLYGLELKPFLILDSDLKDLIKLNAEEDFLKNQSKAMQHEIRQRIDRIKLLDTRKQEQEREHVEMIKSLSDRITALSSVKPEQYLVSKSGTLTANPKYVQWKRSIFEVKNILSKKIKMERSLQDNDVNGFVVDYDSSIYLLFDGVQELISKYDLQEVD